MSQPVQERDIAKNPDLQAETCVDVAMHTSQRGLYSEMSSVVGTISYPFQEYPLKTPYTVPLTAPVTTLLSGSFDTSHGPDVLP